MDCVRRDYFGGVAREIRRELCGGAGRGSRVEGGGVARRADEYEGIDGIDCVEWGAGPRSVIAESVCDVCGDGIGDDAGDGAGVGGVGAEDRNGSGLKVEEIGLCGGFWWGGGVWG